MWRSNWSHWAPAVRDPACSHHAHTAQLVWETCSGGDQGVLEPAASGFTTVLNLSYTVMSWMLWSVWLWHLWILITNWDISTLHCVKLFAGLWGTKRRLSKCQCQVFSCFVSFDFSCLFCFSWFWIAEKIIVIALKYNIIIVTLTFKLSTDSKDLYHRYKVSVTKLQTRWFTHVSTSPHLHHEVLQEVQEGLDWQVQVQEVCQVVQQQSYFCGGERVALPTCW